MCRDKLFLVTRRFVSYGEALIQAADKDEASAIANALDGDNFVLDDGPYGSESYLYDIREIKQGLRPDLLIFTKEDVEL